MLLAADITWVLGRLSVTNPKSDLQGFDVIPISDEAKPG
jgi:hypothetical protein